MTSPPCWDLKVGSGWAPCENTDRKPETALRPSLDPLDRDDDGQHTCGLSSVHNDRVDREARKPESPDQTGLRRCTSPVSHHKRPIVGFEQVLSRRRAGSTLRAVDGVPLEAWRHALISAGLPAYLQLVTGDAEYFVCHFLQREDAFG